MASTDFVSPEPSYACNCGAEPQDDELCDVCRTVDFREILSCDNLRSLKSPRTIFTLRHIAGSSCPLCTFLRACCPEGEAADGDHFGKYLLKMRRVSPIFGTKAIREGPSLQIFTETSSSQSRLDTSWRLILPIHDDPSVSGRHTRTDEINVSLIQQWLDICTELHARCKNNIDDSLVPDMHVIDCFSKITVPYISAKDGFVTLS